MATLPKSIERPDSSAESQSLREIAARPAVRQAQQWFVRERSAINQRHLDLCRVPAATFFEAERAAWFKTQLAKLGWAASIDRAGNVLATYGVPASQLTVVSAHLDTVYAPSRPEDVRFAPDGRLLGPGTSDNGSGLAALLALAQVLSSDAELLGIANSVMLVANVGEEGEGNLSGMRYFCQQLDHLRRIGAFVVLDGPSTEHITNQALASQRFEVTFAGPGGHSWNDQGTPNPVHALAEVMHRFLLSADADTTLRQGTCSYNFGVIEGGSSINSIPANARAKLDLRSENPALLAALGEHLSTAVERELEAANRTARSGRLTARIKDLGSRPGGQLPSDAPLLRAIRAVDAHLQIRSRVDCASTDANVPLSLGLPAISLGAGGHGGGAHTHAEWYQPDGRDLGLRRILLLLALLADIKPDPESAS